MSVHQVRRPFPKTTRERLSSALSRVVLFGMLLAAGAAHAAKPCDGYDLVLLAGQSNAVGRGLAGSYRFTPAQVAAQPRVFETVRTYDSATDPVWKYLTAGSFQIVQASEPLMNDTNLADVAGRIGFAYSFSLLLASQESDSARCVLIIPAARSGTSVLAWNLIDRQYAGDLAFFYLDMISRTNLALSLLPNSRVAAFLWLQGEADALNLASLDTPDPSRLASLMPNVATFRTQLSTVMAQMRTDIGCVPAMLGNLAPSFISNFSLDSALETYAETAKGQIETAIQQVANKDSCKKMVVVSSAGLLTNAQQETTTAVYPDYTHFSAASQIILSHRFFKAYTSLSAAPGR